MVVVVVVVVVVCCVCSMLCMLGCLYRYHTPSPSNTQSISAHVQVGGGPEVGLWVYDEHEVGC